MTLRRLPFLIALGAAVVLATSPAGAAGADGRWECRVGTALFGHLGIAGQTYVFANPGGDSGRGGLAAAGPEDGMEMYEVTTGVLAQDAGIVRIGHHEGSEYPALYLYTVDGAAVTCLGY